MALAFAMRYTKVVYMGETNMTGIHLMTKFAVLFIGVAFLLACDIGTSPIEDTPDQQPAPEEPIPDDSADPDNPAAPVLATYSVDIQMINQSGSPDPQSYVVRVVYRYEQDPQTTLARPQRPSELHVNLKIITNNRGEIEATFVTDEIESPQRSDHRVTEVTLSRSQFLQDVVVISVESHE